MWTNGCEKGPNFPNGPSCPFDFEGETTQWEIQVRLFPWTDTYQTHPTPIEKTGNFGTDFSAIKFCIWNSVWQLFWVRRPQVWSLEVTEGSWVGPPPPPPPSPPPPPPPITTLTLLILLLCKMTPTCPQNKLGDGHMEHQRNWYKLTNVKYFSELLSLLLLYRITIQYRQVPSNTSNSNTPKIQIKTNFWSDSVW